MPFIRNLAYRAYLMVVPHRDREWLQALVAEIPAVESRGRPGWLLGALNVIVIAIAGRLFSKRGLWILGLGGGLLVAHLGLTLDSLTPHLIVLAALVTLLALAAPDWPWRWALIVALPKPFFVELGWYGPYFYDRFDAYYAVAPALVIAFTAAWCRGFVERRLEPAA